MKYAHHIWIEIQDDIPVYKMHNSATQVWNVHIYFYNCYLLKKNCKKMEEDISKDLYCFQCCLQFNEKAVYDMHLSIGKSNF